MNRKQKKEFIQELHKMYTPPKPQRKHAFLQQTVSNEISLCSFLKIQAGYIRKRNWVIAGFLFCLAAVSISAVEKELMWVCASVTPFFALITVAESNRSVRYGMEELELASRFSLKAIVMARLGILGSCNLILLGGVLPLVQKCHTMSLVSSILIIFLPYLTAAYLNLLIVRRFHGKEGTYLCSGITVILCVINTIREVFQTVLSELFTIKGWMMVMLILVVLIGRECKKIWRQTEEYVWNLQ